MRGSVVEPGGHPAAQSLTPVEGPLEGDSDSACASYLLGPADRSIIASDNSRPFWPFVGPI